MLLAQTLERVSGAQAERGNHYSSDLSLYTIHLFGTFAMR